MRRGRDAHFPDQQRTSSRCRDRVPGLPAPGGLMRPAPLATPYGTPGEGGMRTIPTRTLRLPGGAGTPSCYQALGWEEVCRSRWQVVHRRSP